MLLHEVLKTIQSEPAYIFGLCEAVFFELAILSQQNYLHHKFSLSTERGTSRRRISTWHGRSYVEHSSSSLLLWLRVWLEMIKNRLTCYGWECWPTGMTPFATGRSSSLPPCGVATTEYCSKLQHVLARVSCCIVNIIAHEQPFPQSLVRENVMHGSSRSGTSTAGVHQTAQFVVLYKIRSWAGYSPFYQQRKRVTAFLALETRLGSAPFRHLLYRCASYGGGCSCASAWLRNFLWRNRGEGAMRVSRSFP